MNISAKVTSKGQITLPVEMRKALGIKPGDRINFRKNQKGNYELVAKTKTLEDIKGIIPYDGPPLSTDDIVEIVRRSRRGEGASYLEELRKKHANDRS
jgi:AbrB family looped-hinge helix DNA binding protein